MIKKHSLEPESQLMLRDNLKQKGGSNRDVFSGIYESQCWGQALGNRYYSGAGSRDEEIIRPYIDFLISFIKANAIKTFTEIGCGDFFIMEKVLDAVPYVTYFGLDVADGLIQYNNEKYGNSRISFFQADATDINCIIPHAELLIIRQVLQHLDNASISLILNRTSDYKYTLLTEHLSDRDDYVPNLDKPTGANIRLAMNSGVYVEDAPFLYTNIVHLFSVKANAGVIRTSLLVNFK